MRSDYQTHVFTSTYTADVSGVCSAMYELGGMSVLHDPSGCNSTYSTHDEPRWFDTDSLMFVSGLDETAAVMGDDEVLIRDVTAAAADLHPRFITLCGASIPHIIAFDYKGVAHLIEKRCGIPVLPVPTDGLRSYVGGVGMALSAWLDRFADPALYGERQKNRKAKDLVRINLMGVTPLDFSVNGNDQAMKRSLEEEGFEIGCVLAMGDTFDHLTRAYDADVNVVVSGAGRRSAVRMKQLSGMPFVEGLPVGRELTKRLADKIRKAASQTDSKPSGLAPSMIRADGVSWDEFDNTGRFTVPEGRILVIGEEVFAKSLASAVNALPGEQRDGLGACPFWPDEDLGLPESELIEAVRHAHTVIADPLFKVILPPDSSVRFIPLPHEAYSGRIYRSQIPIFASADFSAEELMKVGKDGI